LGNTLQKSGKLDQADASYLQVIFLKPDYAKAKKFAAIDEIASAAKVLI
tara:strand:+ start:401 stop:547 length:147 start_codon:yes stop_codon:yes gene_type:complete